MSIILVLFANGIYRQRPLLYGLPCSRVSVLICKIWRALVLYTVLHLLLNLTYCCEITRQANFLSNFQEENKRRVSISSLCDCAVKCHALAVLCSFCKRCHSSHHRQLLHIFTGNCISYFVLFLCHQEG